MNLFTFVILVLLGLSSNVFGAEYGQACTKDIKCESSNGNNPLVCTSDASDGVCSCPDKMIFDLSLNQCASPKEVECTYFSNGVDGKYHKQCTKFASCWPTNFTDPAAEGTCACDEGAKYIEKTKLCKLEFGSKGCTKHTDCDVLSMLSCNKEGECVCLDELQKYDKEGGCKSLVGGPCNKRVEPYPAMNCFSTETMDCKEDRCECKGTHIPNLDKTCGLKFGSTCNDAIEKEKCHDEFVCNSTSTKCECSEEKEYHEGTQSCRILVDKTCKNETGTPSCVENAECKNDKCECSEGYTSDGTGHCIGLFGSACSNTTNCNADDYLKCSEGNDNRTCVCKDNYETDAIHKVCMGHIGQPCKEHKNCNENSVCGAAKTCTCEGDLVPNILRCEALFGAQCGFNSGSTQCCGDCRLLCRVTNGKATCQCSNPTEQIDLEDRKCYAVVDSPCDRATNPCITNATCSDAGRCQCDNDFESDEQRKCKTKTSGANPLTINFTLIAIAMVAANKLF